MSITLTVHDTVQPAFAENNNLIVFATDDTYAPYCGVAIASLGANASPLQNYDIVILEEGLSVENKSILTNLVQNIHTISVRFFNVKDLLIEWKDLLRVSGRITIAAYYRVFIIKIFPLYDKALYLDCDIVIDKDIAELFSMNFNDNLVAAVPDFMLIRRYAYKKKVSYHIDSILKLQHPEEYFNSGVMFFNIAQLKNVPFLESCFRILQETKKLKWHDQDLLNIFFQGKTLFISPKWNYLVENDVFGRLAGDYDQSHPCLQEALQSVDGTTPAIIHFSGSKPWHAMQMLFSERFWHYAALTPFYDKLIQNVLQSILHALPRARRKFFFYRVMSTFTWGNARKKYQGRAAFFEQNLPRTEHFLQEYTKGFVKK